MKKLPLGLFLSFFVLSFVIPTYGQLTDQSTTNLGDVVIRFCNNIEDRTDAKQATKSLILTAETEVPEDICIYINNAGPTDITAKLNFVDGTVTADASQKKACQPEGTKTNFGQYVTLEETSIPVSAGKTVETHASITFPAGFAGISYGCVTLQIEGQSESGAEDSMFKIVSRRANFIDVIVDGEITLGTNIQEQTNTSLGNIGTSPSFIVYQTPGTDTYTASLNIKNDGNVAQEVSVTPHARTWFQPAKIGVFTDEKIIVDDDIQTTKVFSRKQDTTGDPLTKKILPGQQVSFDFDVTQAIPLREGSVGLDAAIESTPVFDFESDNITSDMRKTTTEHITTQFFVMPWKLIIASLILLTLLWILLSGNTSNNKVSKTTNSTNKSKGTKKSKKTAIKSGKDDLTKIEGIGPKIRTILHDAGIHTFVGLTKQKVGDLRKLLAKHNLSQHDPKTRKKQATLAKNGKWKELEKLQKTLNNKSIQ